MTWAKEVPARAVRNSAAMMRLMENRIWRVRGLLHFQDLIIGGAMADDPKQTGKPDDQRIDVNQDHELSYWSEKLGVSRDRLREAVAKAGPIVKNVQRELRGF